MKHSQLESPAGTYRISTSALGIKYIGKELLLPQGNKPDKWAFEVTKQLEDYFNGDLDRFDIDLDLEGTEFQLKVWQALSNVPYGQTRSYQWVANQIGRPSAVRAVANAIGKNPISIVVPCHRIIGSNGKLTGYAGGLKTKAWLLNHEQHHANPQN